MASAGASADGTLRATAPARGGAGGAGDAVATFVNASERNPFVLPSDEEVFQLREQDRERREALRETQASQKLWDRSESSTLAMTRKMIAQIGAWLGAGPGAGRERRATRNARPLPPRRHGTALPQAQLTPVALARVPATVLPPPTTSSSSPPIPRNTQRRTSTPLRCARRATPRAS